MHKKIDPLGRHKYEGTPPNQEVRFFVVVTPVSRLTEMPDIVSATNDQHQELRNRGCEICSEIGTILTARAKFRDLDSICNLDFVEQVEMAAPLFAE